MSKTADDTADGTAAHDPAAVDGALAEIVDGIAAIADPKDRARASSGLLTGLLAATRQAKEIRRDAVVELHGPGYGYGAIALDLGLSRGRVQQIVNDVASGKPVHRDQTRRRDLKALIAAGRSVAEAAAELGLDPDEAARLVRGSGRPPGRPRTKPATG